MGLLDIFKKSKKVKEPKEETDNYTDKHFFWQEEIEIQYKRRKTTPTALIAAIRACESQIHIAPHVIEEMKRDPTWDRLPRHHGYQQLAIIRFKEGNYEEVIRLCSQAKNEGWAGDWDNRILRAKKKLSK